MQKSFVAIIPARGGSKRLPRKNILNLAGKPLLQWSIDAGINSEYISEVVVSSDDEAILSAARAGGITAIKRPAELALDTSSSYEAVRHTLENIKQYDYLVLLQPTSPLRTAQHIDTAISLLLNNQHNAVISVCEAQHPPHWSNVLPKDNSLENFLDKELLNKRSQDLQKYHRLNGAIYICDCKMFLAEKSFFLKEKTFAYIMDSMDSIDIDTALDFKIAELLMNSRNKILD